LSENVFSTKNELFLVAKATSFPETVTKIILHLNVTRDENLLCYFSNSTYIHPDKLNA